MANNMLVLLLLLLFLHYLGGICHSSHCCEPPGSNSISTEVSCVGASPSFFVTAAHVPVPVLYIL